MRLATALSGLLVLTAAALGAKAPAKPALPAPQNLRVQYSEQSIDLSWDSVPNACGFHVYTSQLAGAPLAKRRRINSALITSGTHFTYIWDVQGDQRVRSVKGERHHLAVAAVFCDDQGKKKQGPLSTEVDNLYFAGFDSMTSAATIRAVLRQRQACERLPVEQRPMPADTFIAFMQGPGRLLARLIADSIDSREVGGCAPIATILVQLLGQWGLPAYKAEGTFIKEFHAFAIVNIDSVEYVLDFAADQFVPDVAPVLIPRDSCFITTAGRFGGAGQPAYQVARVLSGDQTNLSDSPNAEVYRGIHQAVLASKGQPPAVEAPAPKPAPKAVKTKAKKTAVKKGK